MTAGLKLLAAIALVRTILGQTLNFTLFSYLYIYLSSLNVLYCSKMCPPRVLTCLVIITIRIKIRGVVRTLAMINFS